MIKELLQQVSDKLKGYIPKTRNYDSIDWYQKQIKQLIKEKPRFDKRILGTPAVGKMFLMMYDPKTKKELPYYDVFPLIFIVKLTSDGFIGLNLHYLPIQQRMQLLNALYKIGTSNMKMDETTKLKLSYRVISSFSRTRHARICLKRYLVNRVSYISLVFPEQWTHVASLPLERFMKESRNTVWAESVKKIRG